MDIRAAESLPQMPQYVTESERATRLPYWLTVVLYTENTHRYSVRGRCVNFFHFVCILPKLLNQSPYSLRCLTEIATRSS